MVGYLDIVKGRAAPGILIFGLDGTLVYANKEALRLIPGLPKKSIPGEILSLYAKVKKSKRQPAPGANIAITQDSQGRPCALRGFWLDKCTFIMILAEKIVDKHLNTIDFNKISQDFGMTRREAEVLKLICQGLSNKDIADKLFISEYTIKDHLKRIMAKMGRDSRSGIVAAVFFPRGPSVDT